MKVLGDIASKYKSKDLFSVLPALSLLFFQENHSFSNFSSEVLLKAEDDICVRPWEVRAESLQQPWEHEGPLKSSVLYKTWKWMTSLFLYACTSEKTLLKVHTSETFSPFFKFDSQGNNTGLLFWYLIPSDWPSVYGSSHIQLKCRFILWWKFLKFIILMFETGSHES